MLSSIALRCLRQAQKSQSLQSLSTLRSASAIAFQKTTSSSASSFAARSERDFGTFAALQKPTGMATTEGMRTFATVVDGLKYAESHEWTKVEGDTATIGITDFAQVGRKVKMPSFLFLFFVAQTLRFLNHPTLQFIHLSIPY